MKKTIFLFLMLFATANIYSQGYLINFAATGSSSSVSSVTVNNLTQNTSVTLYSGDILQLGSVGINEIGASNDNVQIYPNPMQGKAELSFYADKDGKTEISIIDISGKEVISIDKMFTKGVQKFNLTGLNQGMYFVNISSVTYFYTAKIISQINSQTEPMIEFIENVNSNIKISNLKSTNSTINMAFNNGDRLLFKGYSGNYTAIVTDVPSTSKTITFNFAACKDMDNNYYTTVQIGNQIWMAENLKTTKYRDGSSIPNVTNNVTWYNLSTPAYCFYNNSSAYEYIYGALYNWFTVYTDYLCPTGWHVPSDVEWSTLTSYLGGENIAGGLLKEAGTLHWNMPNTSATDSYGFTGLPAGLRMYDGTFANCGYETSWWSSTTSSGSLVWIRTLDNGNSIMSRGLDNNIRGYSVRCLKN